MRIIRLTASNIKRLRAIDITPDSDVVEIAGDNGEGKTSTLDTIKMALCGKRAIPPVPVRKGQAKGEITLDLGEIDTELRVQQVIYPDRTTELRVLSKDGSQVKAPQAMLDHLRANHLIDPWEFARMKPKEQRDTLLRIVGLEDSLLEMEQRRVALYDQRKEIGREAKHLDGELAGMPDIAGNPPETETDISIWTKNLEDALTFNTELHTNEIALQSVGKAIESCRARLAELEQDKQTLTKWLQGKASPDIAGIKSRIAAIEKENEMVRQARRRMEVSEKCVQTKAEYKFLTDKINQLQEQKDVALRKADFPIEGLGIRCDGVDYQVMYNGIPFEQIAQSEQLRVSLAIAIALNPKLRIITINDASLLDQKNCELIRQIAKDNTFQVWEERVDPSSPSAIIIQDGMVKEKGEKDGNKNGSPATTDGPAS